jgi:hypothetical protein
VLSNRRCFCSVLLDPITVIPCFTEGMRSLKIVRHAISELNGIKFLSIRFLIKEESFSWSEISGSHGDEYKDDSLLGCYAV